MAALGLFAALAWACRPDKRSELAGPSPDAGVPWRPRVSQPAPPRGMIWIPEGALLAGTPPGRVPRIADEELPGEQVVLHGFLIDRYPYPNEEGAIPKTGVTLSQATAACAAQGKRLCSELEWERACKGPGNTTYEYGDTYRADACQTGRAPRLLPSGYRSGCLSGFGVRDLHGGVWEWTSSPFGRGSTTNAISVRGGNSERGELSGRCANVQARAPTDRSDELGFRCCRGEPNRQEVRLPVVRGKALSRRHDVEEAVLGRVEAALPTEVRKRIADYGRLELDALWEWRPVGNESLLLAGGCAGKSPWRACGLGVAQLLPGRVELLHWIWVGKFAPVVKVKETRRRIWVYGADEAGWYRVPLWFEWGRIAEGDIDRKYARQSRGAGD